MLTVPAIHRRSNDCTYLSLKISPSENTDYFILGPHLDSRANVYAWRIRIITQSRIPALVIAVFSLTAMGMFISRVVPDLTISLSWRDLDDGLGQSSPNYQQFADFRAAPITWLVSSAVTDILVSCFLYIRWYVKWFLHMSILFADRFHRSREGGMLLAICRTLSHGSSAVSDGSSLKHGITTLIDRS